MNYRVLVFIIVHLCWFTVVFPTIGAICNNQPCFPAPQDITRVSQAKISVNSTCGETSSEQFCINQLCNNYCNNLIKSDYHGINQTIDDDDDKTYWKSKNQDENVVIEIDLGHSYFFTNIYVTFPFDYPAAMYIMKSNDFGNTWTTLTYFSTDCVKYFNMAATEDNNDRDSFKVQCMRLDPHAIIQPQTPKASYSPWRDSDFSSQIIKDYDLQREYLATNFRIVLVKFRTPPDYDPNLADSRNFYFAINDIEVRGHCFCNGISDKCDEKDFWKCNCFTNTTSVTGDNCEQCLPLYNNEVYKEGKHCKKCECHNHSTSCIYNDTKQHGVCQNCTGETTGDFCETCLPKYYIAQQLIEHPGRCQACDCHQPGIIDKINKDLCNQTSGQCDCKANVTGRTCSQCKLGHWNISSENPDGCQKCDCIEAGTIIKDGLTLCNEKSGQCECRKHVAGLQCDQCQDGYYDLMYNRTEICQDCFCDLVGSHNQTCDQSTGACYCHNHFTNSNCSELTPGYYVPGISDFTYQASQFDGIVLYNEMTRVTSTVIDENSASQSLLFEIDIHKTALYTPVVRYQTNFDWKNVNLKVDSLSVPFQPYQCKNHPLIDQSSYNISVSLHADSSVTNFQHQCLSEGKYQLTLTFFINISNSNIADHLISVEPLVMMPHPDNLENPEASTEIMNAYKEAISSGNIYSGEKEYNTKLARLFSFASNGGQVCACNKTGSVNATCSKIGGQCSCKTNIAGLNCDRCETTFYNFSENGCQGCACDPLGSKDLTCDGTNGSCRCRLGIQGTKCDSCLPDYYGYVNGKGCQPCNCYSNYSTSLQCDDKTGKCSCLPGISDEKCTKCNESSFNLTKKGCDPCGCSIHGSESPSCNQETGQCDCKTLVYGLKCDSCQQGFFSNHTYGLDQFHPSGCLKCYCSGKGVNCTSKENMYESSVDTMLSPLHGNPARLDGWNSTGNNKLEVSFTYFPDDKHNLTGVMLLIINDAPNAYFFAPDKFLGDKRTSYQHKMTFYLWLKDDSKPAYSTDGDVIMKGRWFAQPLVYTFKIRPSTKIQMITVFFREQEWRVGDSNGKLVEVHQLLDVLSDITELKIRGKWTENIGKDYPVTLAKIRMYYSREYNHSNVPHGTRMTKSVERCFCPSIYDGDACQYCAHGYTRNIPNKGPRGDCIPCSCNNNTAICDGENGRCLDCKYNTAGDSCERCADGYYGDAALGTSGGCQPCSCYAGHQLCVVENDSFKCTCGEGYEGRQCELCSDGFWGNPTEPNGTCTKCSCNGNCDICDKTTGDCSTNCGSNTTGFSCEWCREGFYGDATKQTCQECVCSDLGSKHKICNNVTGDCDCYGNIDDRTCSQCINFAWGFEKNSSQGCQLCNCSQFGAMSQQCNLTTGECSCKENGNATGKQCDQCHDELYDVSQGCLECNCNMTYSEDNICNTYNGQCRCKKSIEGGYYGGRQCTQCAWNAVGEFPSCAQCNETCYENWYSLIEIERNKTLVLKENVVNLWKTFNESTADEINQTLIDLNKRLKKAEKVFASGGWSLQEKKKQFDLINETLANLTKDLEDASQRLTDINLYLNNVVVEFDGTVNITSGIVVTMVNHTILREWSENIVKEIKSLNKTAYENYENLLSDYEEIKKYNESGHRAAEQVMKVMNDLTEVENKVNEITTLLDAEFYENVKKNNKTLQQLTKDSEEISRLIKNASDLSGEAQQMLSYAKTNITEASSLATDNLMESGIVYNNSLKAEREASEARNMSEEYLKNATEILSTVNKAISDVKTAIKDMSVAKKNSENATEISKNVINTVIPVDGQTIQDLSSEILSIPVNDSLVNETLKDATAALEKAKRSQRLSEQAKTISEETLKQLEEIESKIKEAEDLKENTTQIHNSTDKMVREIIQTTNEVKEEFSSANEIGDETLVLLNASIKDIDNNLKCFNESHETAINAGSLAELAHNNILEADKVHNQSVVELNELSSRLNEAHGMVVKIYNESTSTHLDATLLYKDITEAEDLLNSFVLQRDEMDRIKKEIEKYEEILEDINKELEEKLADYDSCNQQ